MKKFAVALMALCVAALLVGNAAYTAKAAEVRPLFNHFASDTISYDEETGIYTVNGMAGNLPRLSSVDYENYLLKTDYSDDLIRFDYRFTEKVASLAGEDWCAYFSFRNFSGESPIWLADYAAYLIFWKDYVIFELYYSNGEKMEFFDESGAKYDPKIEYPPITAMNAEEEIVVVDNDWHSIEINIDDTTGDVVIYRDKGAENEDVISVNTMTDKGKIGILDAGGYSFSTNRCTVEVKDFYFEDPDKTELDDEKGRYEAAQKAPEDTGSESGEPQGGGKGCGCKASLDPVGGLLSLVAAVFVIRARR